MLNRERMQDKRGDLLTGTYEVEIRSLCLGTVPVFFNLDYLIPLAKKMKKTVKTHLF